MSAGVLIVGLSGPELTPEEATLYRDIQPAGYILFSRNLVNAAQTRALTDSLRELSPDLPFIGIDQEGGRVWRTKDFGAAPPDAVTFAEKGNFSHIARFGDLTGRLLEMLGINFNFAPVLDIDHLPQQDNGLRGRCWGKNSQDVIDRAGIFNRRMRKNGVLGCGKHFPTNGHAVSDPHHDLPVTDLTAEDLLQEDLLPYTALMPELDGIMACHLSFPRIDPDYPASLSKKVITGILRDQQNYRGLVLTDDLDMGAITKHYGRGNDVRLAIDAGADLALICHRMDTLPAAISGAEKADRNQLLDALDRVEKARRRLRFPPAFIAERWQAINQELESLTLELTGSPRFTSRRSVQSPVEDY